MKKPLPGNAEWEIIQCCAKELSGNSPGKDFKEYVTDPVDWPVVLDLAGKHGLTGFLYSSLTRNCKEPIPKEIFNQLKTFHFQNNARNLFLSGSLLKILNLFRKNGIEAIPFKGPVQSELIYRDIGVRTFSDLDILVKKENAMQARNLLMEKGFITGVPIPDSQIKAYLEKENFFQLVDATGVINIDLHWEISGRYNLVPISYPAEEALYCTLLLGKEIKTLPPEDTLLHLCIHGTSHCWDKLELICAVAKLATSGLIDNWDHVTRKAENLKCKRMLLLGLLLAENCFDIGLAPVIRTAIDRDTRIEALSDYILGKMENGGIAFSESLSWRFSPLHFQARDSLLDSLSYFFRLFFQPTIREWEQYPLPDSLLFLHYLLRPYRLIKEGLGKQNA